jgi:protein-S-isoprenylcysteine O-methyltransferase Ste14
MQRCLNMLFALVAYAIFFATFLYLIAFVGDIPVMMRTVDYGPSAPPLTALVIDVALIALFGVQHSVMARQGFKRWWTRIVPEPAERSVYVLVASVALLILMTFWRPIEGTVWSVDNQIGRMILWALFLLGWGIVLVSTFLLNHFELFGLQQAWFHLRGRKAEPPTLGTGNCRGRRSSRGYGRSAGPWLGRSA